MFIGKPNGSSCRKIQPHSSTRATPCANAMRKARADMMNISARGVGTDMVADVVRDPVLRPIVVVRFNLVLFCLARGVRSETCHSVDAESQLRT